MRSYLEQNHRRKGENDSENNVQGPQVAKFPPGHAFETRIMQLLVLHTFLDAILHRIPVICDFVKRFSPVQETSRHLSTRSRRNSYSHAPFQTPPLRWQPRDVRLDRETGSTRAAPGGVQVRRDQVHAGGVQRQGAAEGREEARGEVRVAGGGVRAVHV